MHKGIKIINNFQPNHISNDPVSEESLILQLNQTHKHLLDLFQQGYPDLKPTLEKIHSLQAQYFNVSLSKSQKNNSSEHQAVSTKQPQMIQRIDDTNYEQFQTKSKSKHPNLKRFKLQSNKKLDSCPYCPQNQEVTLVSSSPNVYLAMVRRKQFQKYFHFYISTIEHVPNFLALETHIIDEINNFKKCLIHMFDSVNYHPVFYQTYSNNKSHFVIECLAVPSQKVADFPFYFKQSLDGCEGDWGTNKNIIEIKKQKGGLLKQIPRNFRYFYIDFSLGYGYAHIIEDEKSWKKDFALQVLASALGMQKHKVLTTQQYTEEEMNSKVSKFNQLWKKYDWTAF